MGEERNAQLSSKIFTQEDTKMKDERERPQIISIRRRMIGSQIIKGKKLTSQAHDSSSFVASSIPLIPDAKSMSLGFTHLFL